MTGPNWDRVQRLELELATARALNGDLLMRLAQAIIERDRARDTACRLEQELAHAEGRDDG